MKETPNFESKNPQKRGRPKLKKGTHKENLTVRLSPEDKLYLKEQATLYSGGNMSLYLEQVIKNDRGYSKQSRFEKKEFRSLIRELNKIGSNLNQLTKKVNQHEFVDPLALDVLPKLMKQKKSILRFLIENMD